jgi:hypothetical protein
MTHSNRSKRLSTVAVFIDTDGRFTMARDFDGDIRFYDLGHNCPGRYIWAQQFGGHDRWQVCTGGNRMGNTLSWPTGRLASFKDAGPDAGIARRFSEFVYDGLSDHDALAALGRMIGARTYRTRAAFDRHFAA